MGFWVLGRGRERKGTEKKRDETNPGMETKGLGVPDPPFVTVI